MYLDSRRMSSAHRVSPIRESLEHQNFHKEFLTMLRRSLSAAILTVVLVGIGLAGEYNGVITEFAFQKITWDRARANGEKSEVKTIKVSKDVKIFKAGE